MIDAPLDFCRVYIQIINSLFEETDELELDLIESNRENKLGSINNSNDQENEILKINNEYDRELFELLKKDVADKYPDYFNDMIKSLNNLMLNNDDCVKRLNMISPNDKKMQITDYYDNYIKALEYFVTNVKE